jgi:antitoxin VapB
MKTNKRRTSRLPRTASRPSLQEAKVFMTGRNQAIRLPKEYRVSGKSVDISRIGSSIVLTPESGDRWAGLFAALDQFPRDFTLERDQDRPRVGLSEHFERTDE